jgi:hypothetical protein
VFYIKNGTLTAGISEQFADRMKKYEITGSWRKLHNKELHHSSSFQNVIRMMKSRTMRWKIK